MQDMMNYAIFTAMMNAIAPVTFKAINDGDCDVMPNITIIYPAPGHRICIGRSGIMNDVFAYSATDGETITEGTMRTYDRADQGDDLAEYLGQMITAAQAA